MCARGSGWPPPRRGLAFLAGSAPASTAWPPSAGVGPGATVPWPPPKEPVVRVGGGHRGVSGLPRRSVPLRHQAGSRVLWGLARAGFPRPGLPGGAQPSAASRPAPALSSLPGGSAHRYLGSRISGLGCVPRPHPAWGWQGTQPLTGLEPAWQRTRRQGLSSAGNRKRVWGAEPQPLPGCGSEGQARSLALPARV